MCVGSLTAGICPAPSGGLTTNSRRTGEPVLPADAEPVGTSSSSGGQTLQAWSLHSLGPYCDAAAVGECAECDSLRFIARPRRLLTIQPADQDREPHLERRHVDHDASLPRSRHFRKTFSIGVSSFVPETQLRPFLCGPTTACCVRCRGEIDCSEPSLYPTPACRRLNCRLHLQRRPVRWTTAAHDARRICETKDGARRDPRSASRHRRYRHAKASSPNVC